MTVFDFAVQHQLSERRVIGLCQYLSHSPDARFHPYGHLLQAQVVQDVPEYFYHGDILLLYDVFPTHVFVEVKVETRTSFETGNLAIEMYSDVQRKKLGGPFATKAHWYVHLFSDGLLCCIRLSLDVCRALWRLHKGCRLVNAQNDGWYSQVMLLSRNCARYCLAEDYFEMKVDNL